MAAMERPISENGFPDGLRILAVDTDLASLTHLETLLCKCKYHVIPVNKAENAADCLENGQNNFDLVITEIDAPHLNDFKLVKLGQKLNIPVIILSRNESKEHVMKGIIHGASDYLLKPVRIEELKNIWQHVFRRTKIASKQEKCISDDCGFAYQSFVRQPKLKRKEQNVEVMNHEYGEKEQPKYEVDPSNQKKRRLVWTHELNRKFMAALKQLRPDNIVPKKILELMNEEGLTRENVASHLQKYRMSKMKHKKNRTPTASSHTSYGPYPVVNQGAVQANLMSPGVVQQNLMSSNGDIYSNMKIGSQSLQNLSTPTKTHGGVLSTEDFDSSSQGVIMNGNFSNELNILNGPSIGENFCYQYPHVQPQQICRNNMIHQGYPNESFGQAEFDIEYFEDEPWAGIAGMT